MKLEQQKQEFIKCAKDVEYFLETHGKVKHPIRGLVPFEMYEFQKETLRKFVDHRFNVVLKARQLGLSTLMAGYVSWFMIFNPNKEILVIAIKQGVAINFIKKVKVFMRELPDFLKPAFPTDNQQSVVLNNGSTCTASTSSDDAGRSEALSLLILDEAAFINNIEDLWTAAQPTLSTGGSAIINSTPNGQGNFFHKVFQDAESGLNDFVPTTLHWSLHPERTDQWYEDTFKSLSFDKQRMAQEHECSFIASGNTVINPESLEEYKKYICEPKKKFGVNGSIWRWKEPVEGHSYMVTVDTSRGDGSDFSTYHVLDLEEFEQVEEFKGKAEVSDLASLSIKASTTYNKALLVVENNGLGWATVTEVLNKGYSNIYYSDKTQSKRNPYETGSPDHKKIGGFTNSNVVRPLAIDSLIQALNPLDLKFYSKRLLDELEVFIWYRGKPQAMRNYNDDLVIAMAMATYLRAGSMGRSDYMDVGAYGVDSRSYAEIFAPVLDTHAPDDPWVDEELGDLRWLIDAPPLPERK
jgi:hypothetical protein